MASDKIFIKNIILAEDDEDDRIIFQHVLEDVNIHIKLHFVSNGLELMHLLKHFVPDLLFLDLEMPYKNGLECLVEIRNSPYLENLPVIVFSSSSRPSNIQTAYEMGAHLFLIKASTVLEYNEAIKAILRLPWLDPAAVKEQYCVNGRFAAFS